MNQCPVNSLLRALALILNFSTASACVPLLKNSLFNLKYITAVRSLVVLIFGYLTRMGALGQGSNAVLIFLSCSSPSLGGTGTTTGLRNFTGMLIWHNGWVLAARVTQKVSSSHILASDERFVKAVETWSVAADRLSNNVMMWSFTAAFCSRSPDRTCQLEGISSSGSTMVTPPSLRD